VKNYAIVLRVLAGAIFAVALLHLTLGAGAERLLGAAITDEFLQDPVVDSQNRFYGVSFAIYAVLMLLSATDLPRYSAVLRCLFCVFFVGGAARVVSAVVTGLPTWPVLGLTVIELILPPMMLVWLSRAERGGWKDPGLVD